MIIAFSGTDGAGKSTQINRLTQSLEEAGQSVRYIWARGGYTPLMRAVKAPLLRLMGRKTGPETAATIKSGGYSDRRAGLMRSPLIARVWLLVAITDLALLYGLYVRYQSARGRIVICDRYTDDTKIDFARNFPGVFREDGVLWRFLEGFAPRPDLRILLTVPVEVSVKRSLAKDEPFPDDVSTLKFRLAHYQAMEKSLSERDLTLSGTDTIEVIAADIKAGVLVAKPGLLLK